MVCFSAKWNWPFVFFCYSHVGVTLSYSLYFVSFLMSKDHWHWEKNKATDLIFFSFFSLLHDSFYSFKAQVYNNRVLLAAVV